MSRTFRFELIFAASCIALSLLALPAGIYWFGVLVLDPYAGGPHVGSFYGDFYRFLGAGSTSAWLLVLGPYVLLQVARFILISRKAKPAVEADEAPAPRRRTEPKITL